MGRPTAGPSRRRQPKDSFIPAPTPVKFHQRQFPRDSDASFASSRPSSSVGVVGGGGRTRFDDYKDRQFQQSVISSINTFLSSQNFPVSFKPATTPCGNHIHGTLRFLLSLIDFPCSSKLEDDLPVLLKRLNYPFKLNKSVLKSPAAPHQWPSLLALIHWLVQLASFNIHLSVSTANSVSSLIQDNLVHQYTLTTYLHYIRGEDDAVEDLDHKFTEKLEQAKKLAEGKLEASQDELKSLRSDLERLRSQPLGKEELEKNKGMLEDKVKNLSCGIEDDWRNIEEAKKVLAEKERLLEVKDQENCRLCKENEELKRTVEAQPLNARDVERMKRELKALKTDIGAAEVGRNDLEEKCWELDTTLTDKFKDLEALALDCNLELRRLKIGDGIQYQLNPMGTTPAEIMGFDYKLTLKPALNSFAEDIKKSSMSRWEELLSYQQKSNENAVRFEGKRNRLGLVQSRVDQIEAQWNMTKKETVDYTSRCFAEAKQMLEDVQVASHDLDVMEREAAKVRKDTELKLQEATKQSEEEIQMRARELFKLVHSVSKYKEHVVSKISETKRDLSETASVVSEAYRGSFPVEFSNILNANCQL